MEIPDVIYAQWPEAGPEVYIILIQEALKVTPVCCTLSRLLPLCPEFTKES